MLFVSQEDREILFSYFMLQQAIVQNIFPEVQVPTWHANSMSSRYLHRGEMFCTIACLSLK